MRFRIVRLGGGCRMRSLSAEAMDRAVGALRFARRTAARNVSLGRSVATSVSRGERRGVRRPRRRETASCGHHRTQEEAGGGPRLHKCSSRERTALIFDIGGGSTELVLVDRKTGRRRFAAVERAVGVVSLTESEGKSALEGPTGCRLWPKRERARLPLQAWLTLPATPKASDCWVRAARDHARKRPSRASGLYRRASTVHVPWMP